MDEIDLMIYGLQIVLILLLALVVSRELGTTLARTVFLIINCEILFMFLTIFFIGFELSFYTLLIISTGILFLNRNKLRDFKAIEIKSTLFILLLLTALPLMFDSKYILFRWDEFSAWGPNIKLLLHNNHYSKLGDLGTSIAGGIFQSYPPTSTIIETMFTFPHYSEKFATLGLLILIVTGILAGMEISKNKGNLFRNGVFLILATIIIYNFGFTFGSIYTDLILGVYLFILISLININDFGNLKQIGEIAIILSVFVLLKPISIFIALPISLYLFLSVILYIKYIGDKKRWAIVMIFTPIFCSLIWRFWIFLSNMPTQHLQVRSISTFITKSEIVFGAYFREMLKPFPIFPSEFSKLIDVRLGGILLNSWMVLCSILLVNYLILKLAKSRTVAKEIITLIIIFFCYEFLLILAYIFTFDSYEASYVASLNRYNSSILLAVSLLMLKNLINLVQVKKLFTSSIGIGCLFIIAFATPQPLLDDLPHLNDMPARSSFAFQEENISNQNARKSVMGVNRILQTFRSNSTYFISQNSKGLEKYIFNYEVLPNLSNYGCWSIGEPYVSDDIWTCKGNLIDYISNYEYLVIYYSDSEFWQLNSNLLVDLSMRRKSGIYKIEKKGEQLVLRLVRPLSAHYPSLPIAEAKIERVQNIRLI